MYRRPTRSLSDHFPPGMRGTALGLYNLGPPLGQAFGVAFRRVDCARLPAGVPLSFRWIVGIVTALAVVFVREPVRGGLPDDRARGQRERSSNHRRRSSGRRVAKFLRTRCCCECRRLRRESVRHGRVAELRNAALPDAREGMTLKEVALYYSLLIGISIWRRHATPRVV